MSIQSSSTAEQVTGLGKREMEAANYALLRRLAPVIRHNIAGTLQPIAMVAAMLERRLQKTDADPETLLKNTRDIMALSKEAAASCVDLMSWLAPKESRLIRVDAGIAECLDMVMTQLSFRGFSVVDNAGSPSVQMPQSALRNVLTAALISLTDAAALPGKVILGAGFADGILSLSLELKTLDAPEAGRAAEKLPYRRLEWHDVQALAQQESVRLIREENRIILLFEASVLTDPQAQVEMVQV